jgi:hypothetical protein
MLAAFDGIGLQTVPHLMQKIGHFALAYVVSLSL